ncbi:MAG TPA: hypothetical protein VNM43_10925 [Dehalococcoidia bacterium]|nr:hypothetical protein [Dehalococcoidia bacterium]
MADISTDAIFDALKQPLALVEDEDRRRTLERYVDAARIPLERAVFDLLSAVVDEINAAIKDRYEARLTYRPGGLSLEVRPTASAEEPEIAWSLGEGEVEKITIRIPAELKDLVVQAATRAGTSLNSWFVRTLAQAIRDVERHAERTPPQPPERPGRQGSRLTGWIGGE